MGRLDDAGVAADLGITPGDNVFALLAWRASRHHRTRERSADFTDRRTGQEIYADRAARKQFKEPFTLTVEQTKGGMRFRICDSNAARHSPVFLILCKRAPGTPRKGGYTLDADPLSVRESERDAGA